MSVKPTALARLADLTRLRSTVLQRPYNPLNLRTGLRYLTDPLLGPVLNSWYPVHTNERMMRKSLVQDNSFSGPAIDLWKWTVAMRRAKGKITPKKGFGRRAMLRNKTKK